LAREQKKIRFELEAAWTLAFWRKVDGTCAFTRHDIRFFCGRRRRSPDVRGLFRSHQQFQLSQSSATPLLWKSKGKTADRAPEGSIRTLFIDRTVRFVSNDNRESEAAPVYEVKAGRSDIGAAWPARRGRTGKKFFPVALDDPGLPEVISATLFESEP